MSLYSFILLRTGGKTKRASWTSSRDDEKSHYAKKARSQIKGNHRQRRQIRDICRDIRDGWLEETASFQINLFRSPLVEHNLEKTSLRWRWMENMCSVLRESDSERRLVLRYWDMVWVIICRLVSKIQARIHAENGQRWWMIILTYKTHRLNAIPEDVVIRNLPQPSPHYWRTDDDRAGSRFVLDTGDAEQ